MEKRCLLLCLFDVRERLGEGRIIVFVIEAIKICEAKDQK